MARKIKAIIQVLSQYSHIFCVLASFYIITVSGSPLMSMFFIMMAILMATENKTKMLESRVAHLESLLLEDICFDSTPATPDSQESKLETKATTSSES